MFPVFLFQSQNIEHIIQVPVPVPILSTNTTEFLELTSPDGRKVAIPLTITNANEVLQQSVALAAVKPEVNKSEVAMESPVVLGTQTVTPAPIGGVNSVLSIGAKQIAPLPVTVITPEGFRLPMAPSPAADNNVHGTNLTHSSDTHIAPSTSLSQLLTTNVTRDYTPVPIATIMSTGPNQQPMASNSIIAQAFSASTEPLPSDSFLPQMSESRISPPHEERVSPSQEEGISPVSEEGIPSTEPQHVIISPSADATEQRTLTVNSNAIAEWLPFTS